MMIMMNKILFMLKMESVFSIKKNENEGSSCFTYKDNNIKIFLEISLLNIFQIAFKSRKLSPDNQ